MKVFMMAMAMVLISFQGAVFAESGHSHGEGHAHGQAKDVDEKAVSSMALTKLKKLIDKGVVDKSWSGKSIKTVSKKSFAKGPEWVVTIENTDVKDKSKQTLYMFYTLNGRYLAANFTGN